MGAKHSWPMVEHPNPSYKGEKTPSCPNCSSTNITHVGIPPQRGTGAGGVGRMGDSDYSSKIQCRNCGTTETMSGQGDGGHTHEFHYVGTGIDHKGTYDYKKCSGANCNSTQNVRPYGVV
jgi:hypothetical protein